MSTRKKNAVLPRQGKQGVSIREEKAASCGPPGLSPEMDAMLMVGDEHIIINQEVNDNIGFMADYIDAV